MVKYVKKADRPEEAKEKKNLEAGGVAGLSKARSGKKQDSQRNPRPAKIIRILQRRTIKSAKTSNERKTNTTA